MASKVSNIEQFVFQRLQNRSRHIWRPATRSNREEVLTEILAAHINDVAGKQERAWIMQSAMMNLVRQIDCAPKTFNPTACAVIIGLAGFAMTALPASAFVPGAGSALQQQLKQDNAITEVVVVRRGAAVRRGRWVRPARYFWPAGGAIAAGAAIGFVTADTAVASAGAPPAPGYCWYYTDPGQTQGFWDVCPQ
jgi:hypothetical protein